MTTPEQTPAVDDAAKKVDAPDDAQEHAGPQTHLLLEAVHSESEEAEEAEEASS